MPRKTTTKKVARKVAAPRNGAKPSPLPPSPTQPPASPAGEEVRIRMYRQGLGDCFLIRFPAKNKPDYWLMIDCGIVLGVQGAKERMRAVVEDIVKTTGGEVDLLVITHEHWDHVSGFSQAKDLFAQPGQPAGGRLAVKQVWMAWTEDPGNELAESLRQKRESRKKAVAMAVDRIREEAAQMPFGADQQAIAAFALDGLTGFSAFSPFAAASTSDSMDFAENLAREETRYLSPGGKPVEVNELTGVRFFVLGPPQDIELLKKDLPSRSDPETYHAMAPFGEDTYLIGALDPDMATRMDLYAPFDDAYRVQRTDAAFKTFFDEHYDKQEDQWRRIDGQWLFAAQRLALKLDSDTNNTSLVLAMELPTGQVLLFPGDAQVGNWLSWHTYEWKVGDETLKAKDLLERTVFYKVGHHGSHNATLAAQGLDMMTSSELVAMIPVNHDHAVQKGWDEMPFDPLLTALENRTRGRILRMDDEKPLAAKPSNISEGEWARFKDQVKVTELFMEYSIPLPAK